MTIVIRQGGEVLAESEVKSASVEAILIKKDGTRINYGTVSFTHHNKIINLLGNWWIKIHRLWVDFKHRKALLS